MKTALPLTIAAFGLATINLSAATLYVSQESTNPVAPYATWVTAATNIQHAVDVSKAGDIVLVTNGVYALDQPITIASPVILRSIGGPEVTVIDGQSANRCIHLTATDAAVEGFTVRNGLLTGSGQHGGGFLIEGSGNNVQNCWVTGCGADSGAGIYVQDGNTVEHCRIFDNHTVWNHGGGVYLHGGVLRYSMVVSNRTSTPCGPGGFGGGIFIDHGQAINCVVSANSAYEGGGIFMMSPHHGLNESMVINCTLVENTASVSGDGISIWGGSITNCIVYYNLGCGTNISRHGGYNAVSFSCSPEGGDNGTVTSSPQFVAPELGDFRLSANSPCIDAGINLITDSTDILGNARGVDGNEDGSAGWDIGAYEFNSFKTPQLTSAPQLTSDGWMLNITGAANKVVRVQRSSNFKDWEDIWSGSMGSEGVQQVTDGDMSRKVMFYRVVVE